jgi:putative heme iron utilization protein
MKTVVTTLLSLLLVVGMVITSSQASLTSSQASPPRVWQAGLAKAAVGGTIEAVDPAGLRITLLTDFGQMESLPITKVSVLVGVTEGDRVWCEMNEDGKVTKIVKATPIPERVPAPEPRG